MIFVFCFSWTSLNYKCLKKEFKTMPSVEIADIDNQSNEFFKIK